MSVCLFVRHAFERQRLCGRFHHEGVGLQKRFLYRWIGEGLQLCLLPTGDTTKCRSPKTPKIGFFSPAQDDRINRSRRNFAGKRMPRGCYSTPNLAIIGKRWSVQDWSPPNIKNCPKLAARLRGSRPGVQSASLIMTSLMTS